MICSYSVTPLIITHSNICLYCFSFISLSLSLSLYPSLCPLSALAHAYYIEANGQLSAVDGTSCAAPVWAGIIGLINAHRLRLGRPVVGFANPLMYQIYNITNGAAFHDITEGNNRCTESGCKCKYGFPAEQGWDATTGLGTPNVGRMIEAIDALDSRREALLLH